jgi:hypothetical protein
MGVVSVTTPHPLPAPHRALRPASLSAFYFPGSNFLYLQTPPPPHNSFTYKLSPHHTHTQFNSPPGSMLPVSLSEDKGQVPLFYSERVALTSADGSKTKYPFYLRKEDLDRDFASLAAAGQLPGDAGGREAFNPRSNSARRAARAAGDDSAAGGGIPIGLTRVSALPPRFALLECCSRETCPSPFDGCRAVWAFLFGPPTT